VEIIFENTDLMPHNFVIVQPGALEEVGNLAEAQATQPGAMERNYVPTSSRVILASRLLQPREGERLSFTAPAQPGIYPYVCTYPGHWRRMHGALYVVADLEAYTLAPETYLTKNPLPIADPLLKFNRPRTEWKFEDLVAAVVQMDHGRSFSNGKQMFKVATCVGCHKLNGEGNVFGPDLAKPDPKMTRADILREILDPSYRINEKHQSYIIESQTGQLTTGLIIEETPDMIKLVENPLVKTEPLVFKTADIASRKKSPVSAMPKGLLDKLTREEILDLMAYVLAGGDAQNRLFQGGQEHGHGH
jgi:putative heme-binding domain-containing protein